MILYSRINFQRRSNVNKKIPSVDGVCIQTELEFNLTLIVSPGVSGMVVWTSYWDVFDHSFVEIGWGYSLSDILPLSQLWTPEDFAENPSIKIRGDLLSRSDLKRATLKAS